MDQSLTQLGIGGIFAILIVRSVLEFLKSSRSPAEKKSTNGINGVTRSEFEIHKGVVQYKDSCQQIVKRIDENFHQRKADMDKRFDKVESCLGELKIMVGKLK